MIFLAKFGLSVVGTAAVAAAALCSEGFIEIKVHEKHVGGKNINVIVPAALVPVTLKLVPNPHLIEASEKLHTFMPIIDAAIPVLEDCPDGLLVEVVDSRDHVRVSKRGGSIVVDVNDAADTVHVSVPLRAAQNSIREIARARAVD